MNCLVAVVTVAALAPVPQLIWPLDLKRIARDFKAAARALKQKQEQPASTRKAVKQNALGAKLENVRYTWAKGADSLSVQPYACALDTAEITVVSNS
jgi:hypothetical protein